MLADRRSERNGPSECPMAEARTRTSGLRTIGRMRSALPWPLTTDRLLLRPFEDGDLDAFHALRSDPEHTRFVPYGPAPKEQVAKVLAQRKGWVALGGEGQRTHPGSRQARRWGPRRRHAALRLRAERPLGRARVCLRGRPPRQGLCDRGLVDWAFQEAGLHRIHARCTAANEASVRVLAKLGFRQEGRLVEAVQTDGAWGDTLLFGLLAKEWRGTDAATSR